MIVNKDYKISSSNPVDLLQKKYTSWLAGAKHFVSIASSSLISWTNHLIGHLIDLSWDNTGSSGKIFFGRVTRLYVGGTGTNNSYICDSNYLANNTDDGLNNEMYAINNFVNVEHAVSSAFGTRNYVAIGSGFAGTTTTQLIASENAVGTSHNGGLTNTAIAGQFRITNGNDSVEAVVPNSYITRNILQNRGANILQNLKGLSFDNWINTGQVTNSAVIYADTTVDVGSSSRYFIQSLSTSPSVFAGDIEITDPNKNYIIKSPNGNRWKIKIDNSGVLSTELI